MKIIISHDVDHLFTKEHFFRDLIIPKMIIRTFIYFIQRKITWKILTARWLSIFSKRMNRIKEVMEVDKEHNIPSTFFFGMNQGLGMSYYPEEARSIIKAVKEAGFDVGVHGIDFCNYETMQEEYKMFASIVHSQEFGIRTHYVRYDDNTFSQLSKIGYLFDTSEFNKEYPEAKKPYKIGKMWEFPLCIMDGYILPPEDLDGGIEKTIDALEKAKVSGSPYCTILFHDFQYDESLYPVEKKWYDWLIQYLKKEDYEFISYRGAMKELERLNRRNQS